MSSPGPGAPRPRRLGLPSSSGPGGSTGPKPGIAPPHRVRVTSPRRDARRGSDPRPRSTELKEQTGLGEIYLSALLRAQLRLSATVLAGAAVVLGGLPVLFLAFPEIRRVHLGPVPLPWVILGVLVYPAIALIARAYVRQAERIEREFSDLIRERQ
ncbi:MAG TPA: hypothetical protein VHM65_03065 [Candidatus Lustribacter sp.]|nr:hypothetical protein [Candidatus Lustribacter sp.]